MKNTILLIIVIIVSIECYAQCEAPDLNIDTPPNANNSGNVQNFAALSTGEYIVLGNLIVGNDYNITTALDFIAPFDQAYITLRSAIDNSVLAFGYTPLSFTAMENNVEVHFYNEDTCASIVDLDVLALQNTTISLGIEGNEIKNSVVSFNSKENEIIISNTVVWQKLSIADSSGKIVLKLTPSSYYNIINISSFKNGIYFLRLQLKSGNVVSKKILKI